MNIKQIIVLTYLFCCCANLIGQTDQRLTNSTKSNAITSDSIYTLVEKMPQFPGGEMKMFELIRENLTFDRDSFLEDLAFSAVVRFVVTKNGEIKNVQAIKRKPNSTLARALVKVVEKMPLWEPGIHKGKPVDTYSYIPLHINPGY